MAARLPSHRSSAAHHEDGPHGRTDWWVGEPTGWNVPPDVAFQMPNCPHLMSPWPLKLTFRPSTVFLRFVFLTWARTSARDALPFMQARSIAPPITCAAT